MSKAANQSMIDKMKDALPFPVYVFSHKPGAKNSYFCDKVTLLEDDKPVRDRYLISPAGCSCLGWVKFQKCKHMAMLKGEPGTWVKKGCSGAVAAYEMKKLMAHIREGYEPPAELEEMAEILKVVEIKIDEPVKNMMQVVARFDLGECGDLGIIIKSAK